MTGRATPPLETLLDTAGVMAELGVSRGTAEAIMRELDKIVFPGVRKSFVKRDDVRAYVDSCTRAA